MFSAVIIDDEGWVSVDLKNNIDWDSLGFSVDAYFTDPLEAQQYILANNPDLVVTDITMPVLDGLTLAETLILNGCSSMFIVLTAHRSFEFAQRAIQLHIADYILKPIQPSLFEDSLRKARKTLEQQKSAIPDELPQSGFDEILHYINTHLSEGLSLQLISEKFFVNKNYICTLFQKNLHCTFSAYLTEKRLHLAEQLLTGSSLSLHAISKEVGFSDEFYFSRVFKKNYSVSPGLYRKLHQKKG